MQIVRYVLLFSVFFLCSCGAERDDLEAPAYKYDGTPRMDYMYHPVVIRPR